MESEPQSKAVQFPQAKPVLVTGLAWNPTAQLTAFELIQGPWIVSDKVDAIPLIPMNPRRLCFFVQLAQNSTRIAVFPIAAGSPQPEQEWTYPYPIPFHGSEWPGMVQLDWGVTMPIGESCRVWEYLALY